MKGAAIFIIIIAAIGILFFLGWSRVPDMIANNLSKKLGVAVSIDSMSFTASQVDVKELEIGNPRGYSLPKAFSAKQILVRAPLTQYFKEKIQVEQIVVDDIYLGLEFNTSTGADGNWTQIMSQFQKEADLDEEGKSVFIKKLVLKNIQTAVFFRDKGGNIKQLPPIREIVLTNISTEGGFPIDQLMESILGQMLKEVFNQQNLNNMIQGILEDPKKAIDTLVKPFEKLFNATPKNERRHSA
ncbi:MAG: hypothetical protein KR126chlam1_00683 [Chlamydiae bacterium]|nr:hypothetical protein [Chlamydiota bacterium]